MNQQDYREEEKQQETLNDLPVTDGQAEQTKAGDGAHGSARGGGKVSMNDISFTS